MNMKLIEENKAERAEKQVSLNLYMIDDLTCYLHTGARWASQKISAIFFDCSHFGIYLFRRW